MRFSKKQQLMIGGIAVALIVAAGFVWFTGQGTSGASGLYQTPVFQLHENPNTLVLEEDVSLSETARAEFTRRRDEFAARSESGNAEGKELEAAYYNQGLFQRYLGAYRDSYASILKAIEVEPRNRLSWINLSETLIAMGAYESAGAALKQAIDINKGAQENYIKLAELYKKTQPKNHALIRATYEDPLEFLLEKNRLLGEFAEWLAEAGYVQEAIEWYEQLKSSDAENAAIYQQRIDRLKGSKGG